VLTTKADTCVVTVQVISTKNENDSWVLAHEFGHVLNNYDLGKVEVWNLMVEGNVKYKCYPHT